MQPIQPEQATFLLNVKLPAMKNEHRLTKRVIEAVPADKGDYRPHADAMSAFELAWHIASAEITFFNAVVSGQFDFTGNKRPESIRNSRDVAHWYGENFSAAFDRVASLSAEQLSKTIDFRGMFQLPAVIYLDFGLNHSIHHRGQLSVYLRPMGAKVPSIYGESYDDRQARQAAQGASKS
jgi:uncharacterized damage-inducible protein DinB